MRSLTGCIVNLAGFGVLGFGILAEVVGFGSLIGLNNAFSKADALGAMVWMSPFLIVGVAFLYSRIRNKTK